MAKDKVDYNFLNEHVGDMDGYDGLNLKTMAIPFIRILQALSPQLRKSKPEYIAKAKEGDIVNSINSNIYGKPVRFVVGKFDHLIIEWKPNRGGFVQAHDPATIENSPRYQLCQNQNGGYDLIDTETNNIMVETYMYYILLPDYVEDGVCILALQSTQLKEAKKLNRQLMTTFIPGTKQKAAPHFMVFTLDTVEMSNDKGDWMGVNIKFDHFVTPDLLEHVVSERKELPNKPVDYAQLEENTSEAKQVDVKY